MKTLMCTLLTATALLAGCASTPKTTPSDDVAAATQAVQWLDSGAVLDRVAPYLPEDSGGVVILDMTRTMDVHLKTAFGMLNPDWNSDAMMADLRKVMLDRLGLDFTKATWAAAGGRGDTVCFFVAGPLGTPKAPAQKISGLSTHFIERDSLYAIPLKDELTAFCNSQTNVEALAALMNKESATLASSKSKATIEKMLERVGDGDLTAAWMVDTLEESMLEEVPMGLAKETSAVAFSVSDRLVVAIEGSPESLAEKRDTIEKFIVEARQEMAKNMNDIEDKDTFEALAMVYGYHISGELAKEIRPKLEGNVLTYDVSMDTATHPVVVIGGAIAGVAYIFTSALGDMAVPPVEPAPIPQN